MGRDVIIACDFANAEETIRFLDKFNKIRDEVISCDHVMPVVTSSKHLLGE